MSGFVSGLLARELGSGVDSAALVRPRLPQRFEPAPDVWSSTAEAREVDVDDRGSAIVAQVIQDARTIARPVVDAESPPQRARPNAGRAYETEPRQVDPPASPRRSTLVKETVSLPDAQPREPGAAAGLLATSPPPRAEALETVRPAFTRVAASREGAGSSPSNQELAETREGRPVEARYTSLVRPRGEGSRQDGGEAPVASTRRDIAAPARGEVNVSISIGRVEVRAVQATAQRPQPRAQAARMTLEDYARRLESGRQ